MGQLKPISAFDDQGPDGQSVARPADAPQDLPPCASPSSDGIAPLSPETREALDGVAELSALALGVPSTFVCLEVDDQCRIVASHGLSASAIPFAESLCGKSLRCSERVTCKADASGQSAEGVDDAFWMAVPLAADPDGKIHGALGYHGEVGKPGILSPEQERTLGILQARIPSRLKVQEALRESLEHHRFAMELDPLVRWTADAQGNLLDLNKSWYDLTGGARDRALGGAWRDYVHPDDRAAALRAFAEALRQGTPIDVRFRLRSAAGEWRWARTRARARRCPAGALLRWYGTTEDIHDQVTAEHALRESKDLLQTVVDSVSDLIFVKDRSGRFALVNKAMREGCDLAEEVPPELFESDLHRAYREADALVMLSGAPVALDELVLFHGEVRPFETIKVPWRKGDEIVGVVGVSRDIAERIKAETALRESEEHYRYSVELNPQVPWTANPDGSIEEIGPQWADLTGTDLERARGTGWIEAVHPEDVTRVIERWREALQSREPIDIDYRLSRGDRGYRWVRARASPRLDGAGNVVRWYGNLEDIDDHRRSQDALRESEERFRLAAQAARLGIWDFDLTRGSRQWSGELRAILGLPPDAEASAEAAMALVHPDDRERVRMIAAAAAMPGGDPRFEMTFRILRADTGQQRWVCANGWRTEGASGQRSRVLVAVRDITEARTADERIRWSARHDALTCLPNRAAFQDALDDAMRRARPLGGAIGLILVDVDHLKQTNDCFGHDAGDALLRTIADRLQAIAAEHGFAARLGGDEFALLFSGPAAEEEMARANAQLGPALAEAFVHEARILDCRATSGGSLFPRDGSSSSELLKAADMALYSAKAQARGGLMMFQPEMRADLERRSSMISMARAAIDDEQVTPFFQPKVELSSGRLVGFEALLRWQHPNRGLQPPGEISAAFDNLDLALALSDRMFDQTIALMRKWLDSGVEFGTIAINAASAEFRQDDLAERILERLERAKMPAARLELEVTETVFLGGGADHVDRALRLLSAAGVKIALDDFGTGYASLSHLKHYPVDTIKIDRSFVCNLEKAAGDAAIVNAVINLGASLGMDIVAEGIETEAQARYLLNHGCGFGQGYLFGRATAPATIPSLVAGWPLPGSGGVSQRTQ